jgi:hypothetical protein
MSKFPYVYLMSVSRTIKVPLATLVEWHAKRHGFTYLADAEQDLLSFNGHNFKPFAELELTLLAGLLVVEQGHPMSLLIPQVLPKESYVLLDPYAYDPTCGAYSITASEEAA